MDDGGGDLEEELETVRGELEDLQVRYDELLDEQDRKLSDLESEFDEKRGEIERETKQQLDEVQADCHQKVADLTDQLEKCRRAMTGDACGWEEIKDADGRRSYENANTGEVSDKKPEILVFAEIIRKIDGAADDKGKLAKLDKKLKEAETKKREADVKLNESRAETQNLRGLVKGWKESAEIVFFSLTGFDEDVSKMVDSLNGRAEYAVEKNELLAKTQQKAGDSLTRVSELRETLTQRESEVARLTGQVERLTKDMKKAKKELNSLRADVQVQIERVAAPLRDELAQSYDLLMQEKSGRESDRQVLADLWPDGWLMPSILQKYRTLPPDERNEKRRLAQELDAERHLKMDIRDKVLEATKWEMEHDDYGRSFFVHSETGAQEWERPAAMDYEPPPGRDEFGSKIPVMPDVEVEPDSDAEGEEKPAGENEETKPAEAEEPDKGTWEAKEDEWGQAIYVNSATGEEVFEKPEDMEDEDLEDEEEGQGDGVTVFGSDMDPKLRAVHSARFVIEWLRTAKQRKEGHLAKDEDAVPEIEGEQTDNEAYMYDMEAVAVLAAGDDEWAYEPPGDESSSSSDSDDDDDDSEGSSLGEGRPSVPSLRREVYQAALVEEALEMKLRYARRKMERLSKLLVDRIQEVEVEEKKTLVPKDSVIDAEGQLQVMSALAELEASMAEASSAFSLTTEKDEAIEAAQFQTATEGGSIDAQLELLKAPHVVKGPVAAVDPDSLWQELSHRRLVDAAVPRGTFEDAVSFDLAAEALWAGFSGQDLQEPPHGAFLSSEDEWRMRAFFARLEEADDAGIETAGKLRVQPIAVSLREHEKFRRAAAQTKDARERTRRAALLDAEEESRALIDAAALDTAREANLMGNSGTAVVEVGVSIGQRWTDEERVPCPDILSEFIVTPDSKTSQKPKAVEQDTDPTATTWPDLAGDEVRLEQQEMLRSRIMGALLTRDAVPVKVDRDGNVAIYSNWSVLPVLERENKELALQESFQGLPGQERAGSAGAMAEGGLPSVGGSYVSPVPQIVEFAELHMASLSPLLRESDELKAALWEAHEIETENLHDVSEVLKGRLKVFAKKLSENTTKQSELKAALTGLLMPKVAPKPPEAFTVEGKEVRLGEMPGSNQTEQVQQPIEDVKFDAIIKVIDNGGNDGKTVGIPANRHVTDEQLAKMQDSVAKRNVKIAERERRKFAHETKRFAEKKIEFESAQKNRAAELIVVRREVAMVDLLEKSLNEANDVAQRWLDWADQELQVAEGRAEGMFNAEMKAQSFRAKQVVEGVRGVEALTRLQDELHLAMIVERRRALALPNGAQNVIERMRLEKEKIGILKCVRLDIVRIREAMLEEGRRRRYLYDEELAAAQTELRRLRELGDYERERNSILSFISELLKNLSKTQETKAMAQRSEAQAASEPLQTFVSARFKSASSRFELEDRSLRMVIKARTDAQLREKRAVAEHVGLAMLQMPAHADQWLPQSEKTRHQEEMHALKSRLDASVRAMHGELVMLRAKRADTNAEMALLRHKYAAHHTAHASHVESMQSTADHSVNMLKAMIDTQREELTHEVQRYQRALAELAREYNQVKTTLTEKAGHLALRVKDLTSWLAATRYDLSVETAKRQIGDDERKQIVFQWRTEGDILRAELLSERMHTARLELWVAAMRKDVSNYTKEIWLRERMLEYQKITTDAEMRELKYKLWRHSTGLNKVGTDVNALFLFFAQRIANLAGARRHYNEALRSNGAALVLAAMCRGPRLDLRRVAARALGMMGWDGFVEQRLLGWDIKRNWDLWLEDVVPKEELRLRTLQKTFEERAPTAGDTEDEFEAPPGMSLRALIVARRQWALRNARRKEGPNLGNMKILGASGDVLNVLVMLTHEADMEIVKNATLALSVAAFHEHNNGAMGRMPECVDAMVRLCSVPDEEVQAQAAATLANLGYGHELNQRLIGEMGGIERLLDLCCGHDIDVIESSTAALANLVCLHKGNAAKVSEVGGIQVLLRLVSSSISANLLDSDQMSEVQANAAEALANLTSTYGEENAAQVHSLGVAPLVLMCGSGNLQVRRPAALVLGNVSQSDEHRAAIGLRGGVEALFYLCEKEDDVTRANALWALGNLAWHPMNQDRVGRYFSQLMALCESTWLPVRTNAMVCLANALFYNDKNRGRLETLENGAASIVRHCATGPDVPQPVQEAALRALVSLAYTDRMVLVLGREPHDVFPMLIANCASGLVNVQKYSLMVIMNLVVHDENKRRVLDNKGVEVIVYTSGSVDAEVRELCANVLKALADLKATDHLQDKKASFGVEGMVQFLLRGENVATKKLAVEALAEQLWLEPGKQDEIAACGGLEVITALCESWRAQDEKVLLPALWTIRNATHDHDSNKERIGEMQGIEVLLDVCQGHTDSSKGHVLESGLSALINACVGHERNCRRMLRQGLDVLIDFAEGSAFDPIDPSIVESEYHDEALGVQEHQMAMQRRLSAIRDSQKTNKALATSLLQILGPFNFAVCQNCQHKNFGGTNCTNCGHNVAFAL